MKFEQILKEASDLKATDVYLIAGAIPCINVEGNFQAPKSCQDKRLSPDALEAFAQSIMTPEQWEELIEKRELNIAYMDPSVGRFRINALWQRGSLGLVMRRVEINIPSLKSLGLPPVLRNIALADRGIVLVSGSTGSGKSTTMASMLDYRNHLAVGHIVTIEDPIEFIYKHQRSIVTQREVGLDTESFEEALKNTLRQAPRVISIGELRTQETVQFAMHAAETGHLVFATMHSTNAVLALERILHFYPSNISRQILIQLSLNLKAIICQRLIPSLHGGRICAEEILVNNPRTADLIAKGEFGELKRFINGEHQDGTCSFDKSIFKLTKMGKIEESDALKYAESENEMEMRFRGMGIEGSHWGDVDDPWLEIDDPYSLPDGKLPDNISKYTNSNAKGMVSREEVQLPTKADLEEKGIGGEKGRFTYSGPQSKDNVPKMSITRSIPKTRTDEDRKPLGKVQERERQQNTPLPIEKKQAPPTPVSPPKSQSPQGSGGPGSVTDRYRDMIRQGLPDSVAEDLGSEFDLDDDLEL